MRKHVLAAAVVGLLLPGALHAQPRITPEEMVANWYRVYLGREPDAGMQGWANAVRRGDAPNDVLAGILASDEYYQKAGSTPEGFIAQLYRDVAGTAPPADEFRRWVTAVARGRRGDVVKQFLRGYPNAWNVAAPPARPAAPPAPPPIPAEERRPEEPRLHRDERRPEEETIRHWYRRYLGRAPEREALETWADQLRQGVPRGDVLARFFAGPEYYRKAGSSPEGFVQSIYRDVSGGLPDRRAYDFWATRVDSQADRQNMASWLLRQYPGRPEDGR